MRWAECGTGGAQQRDKLALEEANQQPLALQVHWHVMVERVVLSDDQALAAAHERHLLHVDKVAGADVHGGAPSHLGEGSAHSGGTCGLGGRRDERAVRSVQCDSRAKREHLGRWEGVSCPALTCGAGQEQR